MLKAIAIDIKHEAKSHAWLSVSFSLLEKSKKLYSKNFLNTTLIFITVNNQLRAIHRVHPLYCDT